MLITAAARCTAPKLPAHNKLSRPMAIGLIWLSVQLLSAGSCRSSKNRVSARASIQDGVGRTLTSRREFVVEFRLGKKKLASFSIWLARSNSMSSRSRAVMQSRPSPETPSRSPQSTTSLGTHLCGVCGTPLMLSAVDSMPAIRDAYSPRSSCAMRKARSLTPGEKDLIFYS